ncbi:MAG: CocE/NonD family hydrolase [Betaproteobacteria bacterium]
MNPVQTPATFTVYIPLRDGVTLAADVFSPNPAEARPLVLEITPYNRGPQGLSFRNEVLFWMAHGYAMVIADCRGKGDSGGTFAFMANEGRDTHDAIEWLAVQAFCNGRVAMRGSSYTGTNPWYAARERPPHLVAMSPSASAAGGNQDITWRGGIFSFEHSLHWGSRTREGPPLVVGPEVDWHGLLTHRPLMTVDEVVTGQALPVYRDLASHRLRDPHLAALEFTDADYARSDVPSLAFSGWQDGCLGGTLQHFQSMRRASPARDRQHLVVGPWNHHGAPDGGHACETEQPINPLGDLHLPPHGFIVARELVRAFFDHHLKGEGHFELPQARLFLTGVDRWIDSADFPPAFAKARRLYLRSGGRAQGLGGDGRLSSDAPGKEPADVIVHDPMDPVTSHLPDAAGVPQTVREWPRDLAPMIDRPDVLVYLSEPLREPLAVLGEASIALHVATDAMDADFFCRLEDIGPDGRGMRLGMHSAARLRLVARGGIDRDLPVVPGEPMEIRLELGALGHVFRPGHRLRLSVCCSSFPETFPNPGTGEPVTTNTAAPRVARQTVFHDTLRRSFLELPVIDLDATPGTAKPDWPGITA